MESAQNCTRRPQKWAICVSFLFAFDMLNAPDVYGVEAHSNIAKIPWPKQEVSLPPLLPSPNTYNTPPSLHKPCYCPLFDQKFYRENCT